MYKKLLQDPEKLKKVIFETFLHYDTDHNGMLDPTELMNFLHKIDKDLGLPPTTKESLTKVME